MHQEDISMYTVNSEISCDFYFANFLFWNYSRGFEFVNKCSCSLCALQRFFISENLEFSGHLIREN